MAATASPTRTSRVHSVGLLGLREQLQLVRFFGALALKEHMLPRLKVRPLVAELFLTENCNLRCTSCACWRTHTSDELSTAEWKDVIDQLVALRIVKLNFTGGEPLIRRDAIELMAYAHDRGARAIHLNTNGILLDDRRRAAVLAAGVRSFNLSVDGPSPAIHDAIRGATVRSPRPSSTCARFSRRATSTSSRSVSRSPCCATTSRRCRRSPDWPRSSASDSSSTSGRTRRSCSGTPR